MVFHFCKYQYYPHNKNLICLDKRIFLIFLKLLHLLEWPYRCLCTTHKGDNYKWFRFFNRFSISYVILFLFLIHNHLHPLMFNFKQLYSVLCAFEKWQTFILRQLIWLSIRKIITNRHTNSYTHWGRLGRGRMVVGFTTIYAINAYHH